MENSPVAKPTLADGCENDDADASDNRKDNIYGPDRLWDSAMLG
jgi:hypothetical protein